MSRVLPILFNAEMVQAMLEGRKTVTRRVVRHNVDGMLNSQYHKEHPEVSDTVLVNKLCFPPYVAGDILYVRETWNWYNDSGGKKYIYRADYGEEHKSGYWKPSIHMPKEAARIFLKVTGVRAEQLRDITDAGAYKEGAGDRDVIYQTGARVLEFARLWDSTIKKSDMEKYGWNANPWVWVIEFEQYEKMELQNANTMEI